MQTSTSTSSKASTFADFGLRRTTLAALEKKGFDKPTPIQSLAIPFLLQGEDLVAQAQTGTGKTAAFGLPVVEDTEGRNIQTLVLVPTRELANQVTEELTWMGAGTPFKVLPVYGGVGFGKQIGALRRGDTTCLVACPGRLLDLLQRGDVDLRHVRHVILDEADRMLDMGFVRDIDRIFKHLPKKRQTMLFSATLPPEVRKLAGKYLDQPEQVRAETGPTATELTDQFRIDVAGGNKLQYLLALMKREEPAVSVIFTRTKHGAVRLAKKLKQAGYKSASLQGNMSQNQRDRVMEAFREGTIDHLVATDVAARGLDVKGVTHVVNYDLPTVDDDYVHRIGRTGRNGARGRAFALVERGEEKTVRNIERIAGAPITPFDVGPLPELPRADPEPARRENQNRGRSGQNPRNRSGGPPARRSARGGGNQGRGGGGVSRGGGYGRGGSGGSGGARRQRQ